MFSRLTDIVKKLEMNLAGRTQAERAVLLALAVALIWVGGFLFIVDPIRTSTTSHSVAEQASQGQLRDLNSSYQEMLALKEQDPNELSRARLLVVLREQERLDAIEPLLIALMGILVLIMALGVFLPIWDLNTAVQG